MPTPSGQTRGRRTLTLGGGAESSLEGRDVELSGSPKDIRTSPYDLCANRSDRRQSREGGPMVRIHFPPPASPAPGGVANLTDVNTSRAASIRIPHWTSAKVAGPRRYDAAKKGKGRKRQAWPYT